MVVVSLAMGCVAAPVTSGPEHAARAYLEAVASGRAADAWELLSKSARARTTPEAFQRRVASLDEAHRRRIAQKATQVGLGRWSAHWDDADWPLRMENRGPRVWVVSSELPRFDRRDSPLAAFQTFARAFRAGDYRTLLALAPQSESVELTEGQLRERLGEPGLQAELRKALDALEAVRDGESDSAEQWTIRAGRHRAILVRESGGWCLLDLR